jgi:nitrogen-specific signal transduction histidine kinase
MSSNEPQEHSIRVDEVGPRIAKVHHDLKNPLSIICGNAQFLLELHAVLELDEDVVSSIQDIDEAARELEDALDRLVTLRESIAAS